MPEVNNMVSTIMIGCAVFLFPQINASSNFKDRIANLGRELLDQEEIKCSFFVKDCFKGVGEFFARPENNTQSVYANFVEEANHCPDCVEEPPSSAFDTEANLRSELLELIDKTKNSLNEAERKCIQMELMRILLFILGDIGEVCLPGLKVAQFILKYTAEIMLTKQPIKSQVDIMTNGSTVFDGLVELPYDCRRNKTRCTSSAFRKIYARAVIHLVNSRDMGDGSMKCYGHIDNIRNRLCTCKLEDGFQKGLINRHRGNFMELDSKCKRGFITGFFAALIGIMRKIPGATMEQAMQIVLPEVPTLVFGKGHDFKGYYRLLCENRHISFEYLITNHIKGYDQVKNMIGPTAVDGIGNTMFIAG